MAYTDYTPRVAQAITAASTTILRWNIVLWFVDQLIADAVSPWVCRGSSRNGSLGAAFSATPDGVNRWSGHTQPEIAGAGNPIWMVLENLATGHQVCFLLGTTSGPVSTVTVVFALNKFETGGAWRGGGSATGTRPTDVTSSPIACRELATNAGSMTPQSVSNQFVNIFVRKDGRGFYMVLYRSVTPDASNDQYYGGYFPLTLPFGTDLNPYLAFSANNGITGSPLPFRSNLGGNFVGRLQDGTLQEHRSMHFHDETSTGWLDRLSPWQSAYPAHQIAFEAVTSKDMRYWMPDWYICSGTTPASSYLGTRNTKTLMRYTPQSAQWALLGPWDGVTVLGTDVPIYVVPSCAACPPGPVYAPDPPVVTPTFAAPLTGKVPDATLDLGVDAACITDITNTMSLAYGLQNLGMALCRRYLTPRGGLWYDPDYGYDLRQFLNAGVTDAEIAVMPDEIAAEAEKDERVQSCTADVLFRRQAETMKVTIRGETAEGPFTLVLGISSVTVEILGLFDSVNAATGAA